MKSWCWVDWGSKIKAPFRFQSVHLLLSSCRGSINHQSKATAEENGDVVVPLIAGEFCTQKLGHMKQKLMKVLHPPGLLQSVCPSGMPGGPVVHACMYDAMRPINYEVTTFVLQQRAPERCKNHAAFAFTQFYAPIPLTNFISKYLPTTANSCKNPNVTLSGCPEVNKINAYLFSSFLGIFSSDWIPHW